jgi:hypothetical protein
MLYASVEDEWPTAPLEAQRCNNSSPTDKKTIDSTFLVCVCHPDGEIRIKEFGMIILNHQMCIAKRQFGITETK